MDEENRMKVLSLQ
ncbi:hypothetical protein glysoja_022007 [Glycine soja]|nr:hypothetical protein glysoja_022007 [Glycine soja]